MATRKGQTNKRRPIKVTVLQTRCKFHKVLNFLIQFFTSFLSDFLFSEERLAKELQDTKDQLEDTKSRLNQRIMVWNKKALYLYKLLYSETYFTTEHQAFGYSFTNLASSCWLSHCSVANQERVSQLRGGDVELSRANILHVQ